MGTPARMAAMGLAMTAVIASCRALLDADDFATGEAVCGGFSFETACARCVSDSCCLEATKCRQSVGCAALYDCLATCGVSDDNCRRECGQANPEDAAAAALSSCRTLSCISECAPCTGDFGWVPDVPGCHDCARVNCCAELTACRQDDECSASVSCPRQSPLDKSCFTGELIEDDLPPYSDARAALVECLGGCADACPKGNAYACNNAYGWGLTNGSADLLVRLMDILTQQPAAGLATSLCFVADQTCSAPIAQAVTDAAGEARLTTVDGILSPTGVPQNTFIYVDGGDTHFDIYSYSDRPAGLGDLRPLAVTKVEDVPLLETVFGAPFDMSRSTVVALDYDCASHLSRGGTLAASTADEDTLQFYTTASIVPSSTLTSTEGNGGGWVNLPAGPATLTATSADGVVVGRTEIVAPAGALVTVKMYPLTGEVR